MYVVGWIVGCGVVWWVYLYGELWLYWVGWSGWSI